MDVRYRISDKTLFQSPILCWTTLSQSDIRSSDIRLSPISLITDIGLSAHLWASVQRAATGVSASAKEARWVASGETPNLHYHALENSLHKAWSEGYLHILHKKACTAATTCMGTGEAVLATAKSRQEIFKISSFCLG